MFVLVLAVTPFPRIVGVCKADACALFGREMDGARQQLSALKQEAISAVMALERSKKRSPYCLSNLSRIAVTHNCILPFIL